MPDRQLRSREVRCPTCNADPGVTCRTRGGLRCPTHATRQAAARTRKDDR